MAAKLIIDLSAGRVQQSSGVLCSYKHHPQNNGFDSLLEMIRFALICRRCKAAPCVQACPRNALEKVPGDGKDFGVLSRANMLCTGCKSCVLACPFGTIYTELVPFPSSVCDLCKDRLAPGEKPLCVQSCTDGSIDYKDVQAGQDLVEVFEGILVRVPGGSTWEPFLREQAVK